MLNAPRLSFPSVEKGTVIIPPNRVLVWIREDEVCKVLDEVTQSKLAACIPQKLSVPNSPVSSVLSPLHDEETEA